ncbi:MAG TPA: PH domain-containing protein [Catenuloplanes sp.]
MGSSATVRFRQHGALAVAAFIVFIGALPLAGLRWYLTPLLLLPLLGGLWAWRSGTDADSHGLRVRALVGQRSIPWTAVAELAADRRGRASALLTDGRVVRLSAVPAAGLPALISASGQQLSSRRPPD